ncbi:TetR/AcrR family transcriptional regulator [Magnetovibrio sp. PR-2]|uniref:acrylate utilization transcriptional regulator AcuR n=1 Tax=Magnetovibrio sp. PR-2 TaxID=3120356 RepID=UPI002FCE2153
MTLETLQSAPKKRKRGRPPKAGGQAVTRERLVRKGIELLTEHGYASTGLDKTLKAVGVPKGSFYHYFKSKDDFGLAVIEGYANYFSDKLDKSLLNDQFTPLQRLQNFIDDAKDGMSRHDFRRGCLIGNLGQELGGTHDVFRAQLEAVFKDWQARIKACLVLARDAGELSRDANCTELAAFFWIGWEGAILRAKLVRSNAPLDVFANAFFAQLSKGRMT